MSTDRREPAARDSSPAEAIFIVGVSRSGTTLMRRVLEGSSKVAICGENHFMGHLIESEGVRQQLRRRFGERPADVEARRLVDFIYDGGLARASRLRGMSRQWRWTIRHVPRDLFLARYLASDRSPRALFEIMLRTYADHSQKPIMGEKTPAHIRHVDELLEWFPGGRVVHMLRDPRAIYVSELRRRRSDALSTPYRVLRSVPPLLTLFVALQTTAVWLESVRLLERYRRRYPDRYLAVRFEDVVAAPEREIGRVCDFIGIPPEAAMFKQVVVSRGHALGAAGFDAGAADRWRGEIGPIGRHWFGAWLGTPMRRLGYVE